MSLNDVCCYIPAWFGALATIFTGFLAYECSLPVVSKDEEPFASILENIPGISIVYKKAFMPLANVLLKLVQRICGTDFGLRHASTMPGYKGWIDASSPAVEIALFAAMIMSILPAHLMRSMGGGYDNESVAMTAMTLVFWLWTRSLRGGLKVDSSGTWVWGAVTGVAYFNVSVRSVATNDDRVLCTREAVFDRALCARED